MKRLDDRLLSTVYWSLGVVVFLAVLLSGFSWYTNFRIYERDKRSLRDELRVFLSQELENGREQMRKRFDQTQETIQKGLKEDLEEFNKSLASRASTRVDKSVGNLKEEIERKLAHKHYDYLKLKIVVEELANTNPSTRLRTYIEYLQVTVEFEWEFAFVDALMKMEQLMREGGSVTSGMVVTLNATLARIPKDFSGLVENIRNLLFTHTSAL